MLATIWFLATTVELLITDGLGYVIAGAEAAPFSITFKRISKLSNNLVYGNVPGVIRDNE